MKRRPTHYCVVFALCLLLGISLLAGCGQPASRTSEASGTYVIKDMLNRSVTVPRNVKRILALHPVATYLLYRLAPDKLVSVDVLFHQEYLGKGSLRCYSAADRARLAALPVTGVFFKGVDPEQILSLHPDVVVTIVRHPKLNEFARQIGIPVVTFAKDSLPLYEPSIRLIGKIVGNEAEADKLADYWHNTLQQVAAQTAKVPRDQRPRVYYANQGILYTPGPGSIMASIIDMAGGINVARHLPNVHNENMAVSLEQVIKWNPQVILTGTQTEKEQIMDSPGWRAISAVKNHRVYVRPRYGNTDGISAIMGLVWTQDQLLHPNDPATERSFAQQMSKFYSLFFTYHITPEQIVEVAE